MDKREGGLSNVAVGAAAGLIGAAAMHGFRLFWEAQTGHTRRHGIFGFDREADVRSAQLMSQLVLHEILPQESAARLGLGLHYLFGCSLGVVYLKWASHLPRVRSDFGTSFGTAVWIVADEMAISLSSISDPREKSFASHSGALLSHLLFGAVLEGATRLYESCRRE